MAGILLLGSAPVVGTVLLYGQSNMNSFVEVGTVTPPIALPGTSMWNANPANAPPSSFVTPTADGIVNLLNGLVTLTGKPWRAVNGSINGTDIGFLADATPTGGLGLFLQAIANAGVTGADLIFWRQGEGDSFAVGAPFIVERDYLAHVDFIHQTLATAMGKTKATLPFIISSLATNPTNTGAENSTPLMWSNIQRYLFEAQANLTGTYFSHSNIDATLSGDGLHETGPGNAQSGLRYYQTAKSILGFGGGQAHFEIASASTVDLRNTTVTVNHSNGATDWSGSTGFEVSGDNGATWSTSTVSRVNSSSFNLVTSVDKSTTNARVFRYQFGYNPDISGLIVDNSPLVLPLTYTARDIRPTSLSTLPMPLYWDNAYDNAQSGITQVATGLSIGPAAARRLVILGLGGAWVQCVVTITPNIGTAKTATVIQGPDVDFTRAKIAYALLDADADTATSITVTLVYGQSPFATTQMDVWTIPSAQLSSTTPVASTLLKQQAAAISQTINIATSAGGLVIGYTFNDTNLLGTITGTESYATRYAPNNFVRTVAYDSSNNSVNASSSITATYPSAGGKISMCAASWR